MSVSQNLAKHFHEVYFGGNWTTSNLKDQLSNVSILEATTQVGELNTILALTFHLNYYVKNVGIYLNGGLFKSKDSESFKHSTISTDEEWQSFLESVWQNGEDLYNALLNISDDRLENDFIDSKYGSYFRNILGIIEHTHYHLGQIAIIKRLI